MFEYDFIFLCFLFLYKFEVLFGLCVSCAIVLWKQAFGWNVDDCFKAKWWKLISASAITVWNYFLQMSIAISFLKVYCCFIEWSMIVECIMKVIQTFRSIKQGQTSEEFWHALWFFGAKQSFCSKTTHSHFYVH